MYFVKVFGLFDEFTKIFLEIRLGFFFFFFLFKESLEYSRVVHLYIESTLLPSRISCYMIPGRILAIPLYIARVCRVGRLYNRYITTVYIYWIKYFNIRTDRIGRVQD